MSAPTLKQGRIVWVRLGPRGQFKKRPAVIISADADINPALPFFVVAGSTQVSSPIAQNEELLPSSVPRHALTKLKKATVIVCDWVEQISVGDIIEYGGETPPSVLARILSKLPHP